MKKYLFLLATTPFFTFGMDKDTTTPCFEGGKWLLKKGFHVTREFLSFDFADKGIRDCVDIAQLEYDERTILSTCKKTYGEQCPQVICVMCGLGSVACCCASYQCCPNSTLATLCCGALCARKTREVWRQKRLEKPTKMEMKKD